MNVVSALVKRNLKVYLRDKTAVFFSFLSVIIIIGLYALFLSDMQLNNIERIAGEMSGIGWLSNSWVMAGIICVNTITITLASYGVMVSDLEKGQSKDFMSSPIKRSQVVMGYIVASWVLGIIMSVITFTLIELFIVMQGGEFLSFFAIIKVLGVIVLSVIAFSSLFFYILSYIKSANAYGTLSTVVGTLSGFLAGIYVPMVALPETVRKVVTIIPISYSASMLRRIFMKAPLQKVFSEAPKEEVLEYRQNFGVDLYINDYLLDWAFMIIGLGTVGVVFFVLSVLRLRNNKFYK